MEHKDIFEAIVVIASVTSGFPKATVTEDTTLTGDLGLDSLDRVQFLMDVEVYFEISIFDNDFKKCRTVGDCVKLVVGYLNTKATLNRLGNGI